MPDFREQNVGQRLRTMAAKINRIINNLKFYDLSPLASLGIPKPTQFENLCGKPADFSGCDIRVYTVEPEVHPGVQDKFRMSKEGFDLGIEMSRMYNSSRDFVVVDGGRDTHCIPYRQPIKYKVLTSGIRVADRDYKETRTKCDFYLLHAKDDPDYIWIRAEPIKKLTQKLFEEWMAFFPKIHDKVKKEVFEDYGRLTLDDWFVTKGFTNVKCLREKDDVKPICHNDSWVEMDCHIAKTIVYIPYTDLQEGQDWVRCTRRK